jgi:hypothetical protein
MGRGTCSLQEQLDREKGFFFPPYCCKGFIGQTETMNKKSITTHGKEREREREICQLTNGSNACMTR